MYSNFAESSVPRHLELRAPIRQAVLRGLSCGPSTSYSHKRQVIRICTGSALMVPNPRFSDLPFRCQGMHAFPPTRKATPRVALLEKRKTLGDFEPQPCSKTLVVACYVTFSYILHGKAFVQHYKKRLSK